MKLPAGSKLMEELIACITKLIGYCSNEQEESTSSVYDMVNELRSRTERVTSYLPKDKRSNAAKKMRRLNLVVNLMQ